MSFWKTHVWPSFRCPFLAFWNTFFHPSTLLLFTVLQYFYLNWYQRGRLARDSKGLNISQCLQAVNPILICSLSAVFASKPGGPSPPLDSPHFFLVFPLFICCEMFCFSQANKDTPVLILLNALSGKLFFKKTNKHLVTAVLTHSPAFFLLSCSEIRRIPSSVLIQCHLGCLGGSVIHLCQLQAFNTQLNDLTWSLACDSSGLVYPYQRHQWAYFYCFAPRRCNQRYKMLCVCVCV